MAAQGFADLMGLPRRAYIKSNRDGMLAL